MQNVSSMSRRLSIVYVWTLSAFSYIEYSVLTIFHNFSILVFKFYKFSLQVLKFISANLMLLDSVDIGSYLLVAVFERWILTLAHFSNVFFWAVNCTYQIFLSYHILDMDNVPLRVFRIDIHKKCESNHNLLLLVIFHGL